MSILLASKGRSHITRSSGFGEQSVNLITLAACLVNGQILKLHLFLLNWKSSIIPKTHLDNIVYFVTISISFFRAFMQCLSLRCVETVKHFHLLNPWQKMSRCVRLQNKEMPHLFPIIPKSMLSKDSFQYIELMKSLFTELNYGFVVRLTACKHHKVYAHSKCFKMFWVINLQRRNYKNEILAIAQYSFLVRYDHSINQPSGTVQKPWKRGSNASL